MFFILMKERNVHVGITSLAVRAKTQTVRERKGRLQKDERKTLVPYVFFEWTFHPAMHATCLELMMLHALSRQSYLISAHFT